jgi:hypothetical protein
MIPLIEFLKTSGLLHHVVWWKFTHVSKVLTASIIREMILHGAVTQKIAIFILVAVRTSDLTSCDTVNYLYLLNMRIALVKGVVSVELDYLLK